MVQTGRIGRYSARRMKVITSQINPTRGNNSFFETQGAPYACFIIVSYYYFFTHTVYDIAISFQTNILFS